MELTVELEGGSPAIDRIAEAAADAAEGGRRLRIQSGRDADGPWVKVKVGEDMWSPPIRGTA